MEEQMISDLCKDCTESEPELWYDTTSSRVSQTEMFSLPMMPDPSTVRFSVESLACTSEPRHRPLDSKQSITTGREVTAMSYSTLRTMSRYS